MDMTKNTYMYPSFATSILDEIYRSLDGGNENFYNNRVVKNTYMYPLSFALSTVTKSDVLWTQRQRCSVMDEDMASLHRACLHEHKKSRTACFTTMKSKPVKTTSVSEKEKQPISAEGKLACFLNSLFRNRNSKKMKKSSSSSIRGYEDAHVERKAKSTQASTCSWASLHFCIKPQ